MLLFVHLISIQLSQHSDDNKWQKLLNDSDARKQRLLRMQDQFRQIEELYLTFAKKASAFNSWFENAEEDLTDPVRCNSIEEIRALREAHAQFQAYFNNVSNLICAYVSESNPIKYFKKEKFNKNRTKIDIVNKNEAKKLLYFNSLDFLYIVVKTSSLISDKLMCVRSVKASLSSAQADFEALAALDQQIKSFNVGPNPYTWFTMEALEDTWRNLQKIIKERDIELAKEAQRQEENDKLRKEFAKHANAFHQWLTETRQYSGSLIDGITIIYCNETSIRACPREHLDKLRRCSTPTPGNVRENKDIVQHPHQGTLGKTKTLFNAHTRER
uniref:Uncharacterized protein n=1 Tax=Timema bartmani TaxID=61472 RepID=A0A7R9EV03_9NEOP|nr:unnamed protein product [Timema bartmani]